VNYFIGPFIFRELSAYQDILKLKKFYNTPHELLCTPALFLHQKKSLLRGWYDNRMRYVFENCRDSDYLFDPEIQEVLKTLEVLRETLSAEDHIKMKINIYSLKK